MPETAEFIGIGRSTIVINGGNNLKIGYLGIEHVAETVALLSKWLSKREHHSDARSLVRKSSKGEYNYTCTVCYCKISIIISYITEHLQIALLLG